MRIEEDVKLDFGDVLIRPKRSTLVSRKNAVLERKFKFKYSDDIWTGVMGSGPRILCTSFGLQS